MSDAAKELADDLKADADFAIFTLDGERITEWVRPDEDGSMTFDFSNTITDFEIAMRLPDGTILLGEETHIEVANAG